MSDDRETILHRIREGLKHSVLPQARAEIPKRVLTPGSTDTAALAESFSREVQAVGGEVYRPTTLAEAQAQVLKLVQEMGASQVLAWVEAELPLPGIGPFLASNQIELTQVPLSTNPAIRRSQMPDLDQPRVGLTGALAGLADTGSLALVSGPNRARAASLLPVLHIALLPINRLYSSMAAFLAAHSGLTQQSSNLVFITGPSRTSDIEMITTRGVHGPKRLAVILVPEPT